jgi:hypothetical protein
MSAITNVTLAFPCSEKLETPTEGGFYCAKCAHAIIDFRCQSAEALQAALRQAGGKRVCGIFNRHQLSARFLRRVAAASVATTLAATACTPRQDVQGEITGKMAMPPALTVAEQPTGDTARPLPVPTLSLISEPSMGVEPITMVEATTGMPVMEEIPEVAICELNSTRFQEILAREVNQHPEQEDVDGVVRISVTIDAHGVLGGMEIVQGLTAAADREAVRALTAVADYLYFEQTRGEDGVADGHKAVVTVTFGEGTPHEE